MLDETNYTGTIDISLKIGKTFNVDSLNSQLTQDGLKLLPQKKMLKAVVIQKNSR
jgi:hypothetical protein